MSALISFLGGSVFRMLWGEVSAWFTARQEHMQEVERLKLQAQIDAAQHARNLESMRLHNELGIKTIEVQRDAAISQAESDAWADIVRSTSKKTGIRWLDAWNGSIRPFLATLAILLVVVEVVAAGFVMSEWSREIVGAILGIYLADRALQKRGK
jgi:hypothetical protein